MRIGALAVLSCELDHRIQGPLTEVLAACQQALRSSVKVQGELADWSIGDQFERVANSTTLAGVDFADQGDVDLAVEGGDKVGEFVARKRGTQVDGALEGFFEQRSFGFRVAIDGGGGTLFAKDLAFGENRLGADGADVGVVEQLGVGQGYLGGGDVRFAELGGEDRMQGRVLGPPGTAGELEHKLGFERKGSAVGNLEIFAEVGDRALVTGDVGRNLKWAAVRGIESKVGTVEVDAHRTETEGDSLKDLGQWIRYRRYVGVGGVDVQGDSDHYVAEVIRTRDRRGDHGEAERGAFVRTCEVNLARDIKRMIASPDGGAGGANLARFRAAEAFLLCQTGVAWLSRPSKRRIRAVCHPRQRC
jgi:hypothetical protein